MRRRRPLPAPVALRPILALAAALSLAACGGGSSGGGDDPDDNAGAGTDPVTGLGSPGAGGTSTGDGSERDLGADPTWRLDDRFDYASDPANSLSQVDGAGGPVPFGVTVISTSGFGDGHGAWSGSGVGFSHSLDGDGTYAIVTIDDFVRSLEESPGSPVVHFYVQAGLNATGDAGVPDSTRWESTSGTVEAVVDEDGIYHFFADEPLPVTVQLELGSGIPDRPEDTTITFANVYGRRLP